MAVETLRWQDDHLVLLDQTRLPGETIHLCCRDVESVAQAIERLSVRGAPAIGVAAAYGTVLAALSAGADGFVPAVHAAVERLAATRPTAVNLFWALDRMRGVLTRAAGADRQTLCGMLLDEAAAIDREDRQVCRAIGRHGAGLLPDDARIITHCNAGALATADYGTALGVVYAARDQGKRVHVFADETRPLLQGARLTAWELLHEGIEVTLICDSMAAAVMRRERIDCVLVGADRIAANGDAANKIGTYGLAVAARAHGVPVYVAAPRSTIDMSLATGELIPIEERGSEEITCGMGRRTAPAGVRVYNPAFDVTPNELIAAIISECGVARPPLAPALADWMRGMPA
jgi:methylthioribose-1-phosphate isomerase